jgi:hypothetical protein
VRFIKLSRTIAAATVAVVGTALLGLTPGLAVSQPASAASAADFAFLRGLNPGSSLLLSKGGSVTTIDGNAADNIEAVALAPDGSFAVVTATLPGDSGEDLYRVDLSTHTLTDITNLPGQELYPAISPDGKTVAFLHTLADQVTPMGIYTVNIADGSGLRRITPLDVTVGGVPDAGPAWSHDGSRLAVPVSFNGGSAIEVFDIISLAFTRPLSSTASFAYGGVAWTPDDAWLVYPNQARQLEAFNLTDHTTLALGGDTNVVVANISIANDWTIFYEADSRTPPTNIQVRERWLGDASTDQVAPGTTDGDSYPSVAQTGAVAPAPPNFGGNGSQPTPTPTVTSPAPTPTPTTTPPPGYRCGTAKFFGLRGSGEQAWDGEGMGTTVDSLKNSLTHLIPGLRFEAVDYPAVAVQWWDPKYPANYVDSEITGVDALLQAYRTFVANCPHTYAFWAGFSQGAEAVGDAYDDLTTTEKAQIAGVLEFGNPVFNPNQPLVDEGDYNPNRAGILLQISFSPQVVTGKWRTYVRSYCTKGDPVCGYALKAAAACNPATIQATCSHLKYVQLGWVGKAAQWAFGHWQRLHPR